MICRKFGISFFIIRLVDVDSYEMLIVIVLGHPAKLLCLIAEFH